MIWAAILLGELVLCLADPKSFVYVSEIEDDDYPPPIDFRYYDRQRYTPPHLQKYSITSKQDINPDTLGAKDNSGRNENHELSSAGVPSTSSRADNEPGTQSLPAYDNTGPSSSNRPGSYSSSSQPRTNPLRSRTQNGPSSYITFHPPGTISNVNYGSGSLPGQRGTKLNLSSQSDFNDKPLQKHNIGNPRPASLYANRGNAGSPRPVSPYTNGGNTGVLPPSSVLSGRSASPLGGRNSGAFRSPTYSNPQSPHSLQTPLRSFDLLPDRDFPRDGGQRATGNNPSRPSDSEDSSNKLKPITDIINKLPGCPFPRETKDGRNPGNYVAPSSRPTSSFRRSIAYGRGDSAGIIVTSINRASALYTASPSYTGGRNTSEQNYYQLPRGNTNSNGGIRPITGSYQYSRQGNFPQFDRGSRYNNIPQPGTFEDSSKKHESGGSNLNTNDFSRPDSNTDIIGSNRYRKNQAGSPDVIDFNNNPDDLSTKARPGNPGNNGQIGVRQGNSNEEGINSNRQRSANAPTNTRNTNSFINKVLASIPTSSSNLGNSAGQRSQSSGNFATNKQQQVTRQEYSIYRPSSYQTIRSPQPHEKYPSVGIKEHFGPAHLAIAPLPPDVDGDQIPGQAWVDYPIYHVIPTTSFSCAQQPLDGYYADMEGSCQVYHFCQPGGVQTSFLCPNGTIFSQKKFACQWWYKTDCTESPHYFSLNSNLYKIPVKVDSKQ